ncbi:hypothetical protein C8Q76DRAFT_480042 [Earliella scabrosa]|nr:hypothetical protein C8Q76DRAFT_480042 [Earliella scabrosa]
MCAKRWSERPYVHRSGTLRQHSRHRSCTGHREIKFAGSSRWAPSLSGGASFQTRQLFGLRAGQTARFGKGFGHNKGRRRRGIGRKYWDQDWRCRALGWIIVPHRVLSAQRVPALSSCAPARVRPLSRYKAWPLLDRMPHPLWPHHCRSFSDVDRLVLSPFFLFLFLSLPDASRLKALAFSILLTNTRPLSLHALYDNPYDAQTCISARCSTLPAFSPPPRSSRPPL